MKWLNLVDKLAKEESNSFVYKRVWIDKKEGDAARPLGVPAPEHRIYGHMFTRIIEAYLCGTDQYTSNQHGGTPRRGTMTYIRELAKRFTKHKRIYEFDLKGYFDHLSHKSITEMFQSKVILHYLSGVLKAKPTEYKLPATLSDHAYKEYESVRTQPFEDDWGVLSPTYEDMGFIGIHSWESILDSSGELLPEYEGVDPARFVPFSEMEEWDLAIAKAHKPITLSKTYKGLMEGEYLTQRIPNSIVGKIEMKEPTETDREEGRDNWKDLDLPDQGVPQGSSLGPVIASVLLGKVMPRDSLIYMDDGIVFLKDSDQRSTEQMNERYNQRVSTIMCEVNKSKSRILETSDLISKGLKIIGTRWIRTRELWTESFAVSSETRRGAKRLLFEPTRKETEKIFAEFLNSKVISPSKARLLRWYVRKGKLERIVGSELFKVAERIQVLGNILSRAYSPETSLEELKERIEYGIFKAELKLKSTEGSLGQRVINGCKTIVLETTEGRRAISPTLYNTRAICNNVLLRYLKGELPVRQLRVQGLRKKQKQN
jgi:hypothetical protein